MARKPDLSAQAQKALRLFEETEGYHRTFVDGARRRYRAYKGILEVDSEAADWQSKLHPPYVRHHVETMIAGLVSEPVKFRVRPKPRMYDSAEEAQVARIGAQAHEILHNFQLAQDRFDEKMRPFVMQAAIVNFSVMKNHWRSDVSRKPRLQVVDVGIEKFGYPIGIYDLQEVEEMRESYVGPCSEVVNVEDFFWHEAAVSLQRSPVLAHRVLLHFSELKELERQGVFSNVDELSETRDFAGDTGNLYDHDDRQRDKDMVEVLEVWHRENDGIRVVTLGNRAVELKADRPNPFWHGEYPFVDMSLEPEMFEIPGNGPVEKVAHLQSASWDLLNQTLDNVRLQNNFIIGVNAAMVEDADALEWAPGERWLVENGDINQAIQVFHPESSVTNVAWPMISAIQRDMQTLAGSQPFTTTSEAGRMGADTATEAALLGNIAQQSVKAMQHQIMLAIERVGQQRTELNQQFIRRPVLAEQIGLDSEMEFVQIAPEILQGDYLFDIKPMAESLMRSERRAESNALIQTWLQIMGVWLPLAQAGAAPMPNGEAFLERWLEGYDEDPRHFFSQKQAPTMQAGGAPQPQQQPSPDQGGGQGITSPLAAGPTTPSGQTSVSPASHMARLMSQRGGVANT